MARTTTKPVRVQDLPENAGETFLYCEKCQVRYSATKGDYFFAPPDHVFKHCRRNMILARAETTIIEVSP